MNNCYLVSSYKLFTCVFIRIACIYAYVYLWEIVGDCGRLREIAHVLLYAFVLAYVISAA